MKGIPTGPAGGPEGGGHEQDQPVEADGPATGWQIKIVSGNVFLAAAVRSLTGALDCFIVIEEKRMDWRKIKVNDVLLVIVLFSGNGFYWQYRSSELDRSKYDLSLRQAKENSKMEQERLNIDKSKHLLELSKNEMDRDRKTIDAGKYEIEKRKHEIDVRLFELEKEKYIVSKEKFRTEKIKEIVTLRDRKSELLTQIILLTENYMALNEKTKTSLDQALFRKAIQDKMKLDALKKNYNELEINIAELENRQSEIVNLDFVPKVAQPPSGLIVQ